MRRATVYDVAERAGVSIATVSFTYRQPNRVRESTRRKVLAAARELDYIPSANARGLAKGRTGVLGLYSFDLLLEHPLGQGNPASDVGLKSDVDSDLDGAEPNIRAYPLYVDEVQRGFELECWHQGQAVLLSSSDDGKRGESITDLAGRVDGLALFSWGESPEALKRLAKTIPVVMLSQSKGDLPVMYLSFDNESGMNRIVDHLVDVHGARRIVFIGTLDFPEVGVRLDILKRRVHKRGLPACRPIDAVLDHRVLYQALAHVVREDKLPDALVCANDQMALSVMDVLLDLGIRVPGDVIVTGVDGILAGRFATPALTTVQLYMERLGRMAADSLAERDGQPWKEPRSAMAPARLVVRESCGCHGQAV